MQSTRSGTIVAALAAALLVAPAALAQQQGQAGTGRAVPEVRPAPAAKEELGQAIALTEVPPAVMQAANRELKVPITKAEKMMVYTRPVYELTGKSASGEEVRVKVNDDGTILPSGTERR